jgi:hypothetical protein
VSGAKIVTDADFGYFTAEEVSSTGSNEAMFRMRSLGLFLSEAFELCAGAVGFIEVRWTVLVRRPQQRNRYSDIGSEQPSLTGMEVGRADLFTLFSRIGIAGRCEHRLLVNFA